ncbi:flagellar hook-associated protein FlgK [Methylibium sp.]|uniref:flagellar hook-associated protein FlgK n=1 Tax=Methylibium sp. TaxID=2067992 RepID=UPI00182418AA|nr:flagellar hook-associated protein FlgK [Methylibium sp.]MBA3589189.1 flagellar hook-associated protein FlgK [Methylibium sp.]
MAGLMSLGTRAMFANYAALQATGSNISNANTPGYSRQQVELSTAGGQYTGAGFFGNGAQIDSVTRAADSFLTRAAAASKSQAAFDATHLEQLKRLESVFPPGESGIGFAAGQLLNAFVDVANRPQDAAARQVVLARTEELTSRLRAAGGQIDTLQSGVAQDFRTSIATVNTLAQRVADINKQIASALGTGHTPNDLLDQRDQLVSEISGFVQVSTITADDGTLGLFIGGGQRLVLGGSALELKAMPDLYDPAKVRLGVREGGVDRGLPTGSLGGGSLAGLLAFQDDDLTDAQGLVGRMAAAIAGSLNEQQALGLDLRQPAGSGAPLMNVGAPRVLPASTNTGGSTVGVQVTHPAQLQASDYELRADPAAAGSYLLTRLSDGMVRSVASGDTIDGFAIDVGTPAPAAGDRFLLQPVSRAAQGASRALDDPKGIAAAAPLTATANATNEGTGSVASVKVTNAWPLSAAGDAANTGGAALALRVYDRNQLKPQLPISLSFAASGSDLAYTWNQPGATPASGTGIWDAQQPIRINGVAIDVAGTPAAGDNFDIAAMPQAPTEISFSLDASNRLQYTWTQAGATPASGTGLWDSSAPVRLNGADLRLNGVPQPGDSFSVSPAAFSASNNGNALALLDLRDAGIVGEQRLADGSISAGESITSAYASALADIGVRVQSTKASSNISTAVAANADAVKAAATGVNLDEEAARLIQYQQGYQAAAKILQVAQSVFDTLLSVTGR